MTAGGTMNKTQVADIDRTRVGKMLMNLFGYWKISTGEQLSLLGLPKDNRKAITQYRNGQPLSKDRDKLERAGMLLGIHKSLRLLFPHNRELAYGWMTQPNRAFKGATPVQLIDEQGMAGLYMVRTYLDVQRGDRHGFWRSRWAATQEDGERPLPQHRLPELSPRSLR